MSVASVKTWFNTLTPDKKRKVVVGGVLLLILVGVLLAVVATDSGTPTQGGGGRKKKVEASILTGRDPQKVGIEQLLANSKRSEAEIDNLKRELQSLRNQQGGGPRGGGAPGAPGGPALPYPYANGAGGQEVVALPGGQQDPAAKGGAPGVPVPKASDRALQQAIGGDPTAASAQGGRTPALPPPNIPGVKDNSDVFGGDGGATPDTPPAPAKVKLRVLTPRQDAAADSPDAGGQTQNAVFTQGGRGAQSTLASLARNSGQREQEFYIPMGAILSGTLLTGVDAPASGSAAKKDPFPALFRIKREAVLPNSGLLDIRECFIVASAYADLSSERVYMRAEGLSCYRSDGAIIEASMDAFATGTDGKAGIGGTVVEKTGQLVARSLMAGFVSGMATAFKPQQSQQVQLSTSNTSNGGNTGFTYPDPAFVLGNSLLGGASSAADRVATIYEDLARQIVPVVSISAGIPVDFIMTRGATLRFKRVGEISGSRVAGSSQQQGQGGQRGQGENVTTSVSGSTGGPFAVTPGPGSSSPARPPSGSQTLSSVSKSSSGYGGGK